MEIFLPIKNEFAAGLLELSRLAVTERVSSSRRISSKPVWLIQAIPEADNTDNVFASKLINGETSSAEVLVYLRGRYGNPVVNGAFTIYFNRGLYVELTDNLNAVTIQYLIDSP